MRYGEILRIRAETIWDILVDMCGADPEGREVFVTNAVECPSFLEYRFQGNLGFGGKVYFGPDKTTPYVSCYKEHLTETRCWIIEKANKALVRAFLPY